MICLSNIPNKVEPQKRAVDVIPPALTKSFPTGAYIDASGQGVVGFLLLFSCSQALPLASGVPPPYLSAGLESRGPTQ